MDRVSLLATFAGELAVLGSAVIPVIAWICRLSDGMRCQLRTEMLRIYYHNREKQIIRQYEYENFVYLYKAYKSLKGNSFIDKIYREIQTWEVIS